MVVTGQLSQLENLKKQSAFCFQVAILKPKRLNPEPGAIKINPTCKHHVSLISFWVEIQLYYFWLCGTQLVEVTESL